VRGRCLLLATAVLAAAGPAAAFVRRTDSQTGACLYWAPREVFWTMRPPEAGAAPPSGILHPSCDGGAAEAAVRAGFAAWTGAAQGCTDLALTGRPAFTTSTFVGYDPRLPSAQQESLVVFRRGWCSQVVPPGDPCEVATGPDDTCPVRFNCFDDDGGPADWATIGQTITTFVRATGQLLDADIELNAWDGTGAGSAALPVGGTAPLRSGVIGGYFFSSTTSASMTSSALAPAAAPAGAAPSGPPPGAGAVL